MLLALWSAVLGVALCIVYDVFRFFRIGFLRGNVGIFICDIAFCMFATAGMLVLFFNLTNGRIREYAFLFVIFGFLLWRFTAGRVLMLAATAAAGTGWPWRTDGWTGIFTARPTGRFSPPEAASWSRRCG